MSILLGASSCRCSISTQNYHSRYPRAEPVALLTTIQASLDALWAISHSPTGKAHGTLPFGFIRYGEQTAKLLNVSLVLGHVSGSKVAKNKALTLAGTAGVGKAMGQ